MDTRSIKATRSITWSYINQIVNILMPFLLRTFFIYSLDILYSGISNLFSSILQVLNLTELGFGSAIIYSMYKPVAENDKDKICALLSIYKKIYKTIGNIIFTLGLLILPFIQHLIKGKYPSDINIYIVYFIFLLNSVISYWLFAYKTSLLLVFQKNAIDSKVNCFVSVLQYSIQIIIIVWTKNYYLYLISLIVGTIISNIIKYIIVNLQCPNFYPKGELELSQIITIKKNVVALLFHKIGGTVLNSVDNVIISTFLGLSILTKYANYYFIMNAFYLLVSSCLGGLTSIVGNAMIVESKQKNYEIFKIILFVNAIMSGFFMSILLCLLQDFIFLWIGKRYLLSSSSIFLIAIYFFIHSIRKTIMIYRDAAGLWTNNKFQPLVSAIFNLIVNIILVNTIGLNGVIISSIFSMIIIDIPWETRTFFENFIYKEKEYYILLLRYSVFTACLLISSYSVSSFINISLIVNLFLKFFVCFFLTIFFSVLFFGKMQESLYIRNKISEVYKKFIFRRVK